MSFWQRVKDFFVGPPRARHERDDWDDAAVDWPPLNTVPDQPDAEERVYPVGDGAPARGADEEQSDRVLADHEPHEVGEVIVDDDGNPVRLLGLFSGRVREGYLVVRQTSGRNATTQYLIRDEENGVYWPASTEELSSETTTRLAE